MELADKDGNGELDYNEFHLFFSKIESMMITDEDIRQIFDDFDGSGNGMLSVEEFARAIYQAILAENDDYSDDQL
jgi:Ca2+-binding EF-hand superfamily protein